MHLKLSILVIFSMFSIGCSQNTATYIDSKDRYSLDYDEKIWELKENNNQTLLFLRSEDNPTFKSNVNIMVQDLTNNPMTLEGYHQVTIDQINSVLGEKALVSSQDKGIAFTSGKQIVYVMEKAPGNPKIVNLKINQAYILKDNKAYLLTFTTTIKRYAGELKKFEEILKAFRCI